MKRYYRILGAIAAGATVFLLVMFVAMMAVWAWLIVESMP